MHTRHIMIVNLAEQILSLRKPEGGEKVAHFLLLFELKLKTSQSVMFSLYADDAVMC